MRRFVWVLMFLMIVSFPAAADIAIANVWGTAIQFTGAAGASATFTMTTNSSILPGKNVGFQITNSALQSYYGAISGTYQYLDSDIDKDGNTQTAPVSLVSVPGTNIFTIWDSSGTPFTADVAWIDIQTNTYNASYGGLDTQAKVNLTGFAYAGSDPNMSALAGTQGTLVATFVFLDKTLDLEGLETGVHSTSYAGTLTVPDGGLTLMLLGGALVTLEGLRRKRFF